MATVIKDNIKDNISFQLTFFFVVILTTLSGSPKFYFGIWLSENRTFGFLLLAFLKDESLTNLSYWGENAKSRKN